MLLLVSVFGQAAQSPEAPVVRIEVHPETMMVGEGAEIRVTVLGPTWFPMPPVFPSFEVPNAIVRLPPDRSGPTSAQVNGARWSGVTRVYEVFPLMSATYRLGGGTMKATVADPGAESQVFEVAVPEVTLKAEVPAGAEAVNPYLAGTGFRLWRELEGEVDNLESGDALVVRYLAELDGMPAIFLPPLTPQIGSEIVAVYADEPDLSEAGVSRRSERTTLVMKYGGTFTLPAVTLQWWNRTTNRVEDVSIAELVLSVNGPAIPTAGVEAGRPVDWRLVIPALLLLSATVYLAARYLPLLRRRLVERRKRHLDSEQYAFARFQKACRGEQNRIIYPALIAWQQKLCPELALHQFAECYGDRMLQKNLAALSSSLYADLESDFSASELARAAGAARRMFLDEKSGMQERLLPGLNP